MVEGFIIGVLGLGVCKWSEAGCLGSEDSLSECNGDRGDEETRWDVQPVYDWWVNNDWFVIRQMEQN